MKKLVPLILLSTVFFSKALLAQSEEQPPVSNPVVEDHQAVRHFGTSNRFPIGTPDHPVTVQELCVFLNTFRSPWVNIYYSNNKTLIKSHSGIYYDKTLMQTNVASPDFCIITHRNQYGVLEASPKRGCANDIVDALASDGIYDGKYKMFLLWTKNPTMGEVVEYLNDRIQSHYASDARVKNQFQVAANELKNRYSSSSVHAFETADKVVDFLVNEEDQEVYQFADLITFSKQNNPSMPFVAHCAEENFFYRYDLVYCNIHPYNLKETCDGITTPINLD